MPAARLVRTLDVTAKPIRLGHAQPVGRASAAGLGTLVGVGNDFLFSGERWITIFPGAMLVLIALSVNLLEPPGHISGGEFLLAVQRIDQLPCARMRAIRMLQETSIQAAERRLDQYPHKFSDGMRLRVVIALAVVRHVADQVAVMEQGRLVEMAAKAELFIRPRHPHTGMLLDAIPDDSMSGRARTPVQGEVPNPLSPPAGDAFHPRYPHANPAAAPSAPP